MSGNQITWILEACNGSVGVFMERTQKQTREHGRRKVAKRETFYRTEYQQTKTQSETRELKPKLGKLNKLCKLWQET